MEKTGIAVVGCGAIAQGTHLPNIVKNPAFNLRWCCDIDRETLLKVGGKFNAERTTTDAKEVAMDDDCKIIVLSTTQTVRYEMIELFSEAGKHIYVEKPLADNFQEMFSIARQVKKTGIKFCVGHNRRCAPAFIEAREVYLKHKMNPASEPWRWDRTEGKRPHFTQEKQTVMLLRINDDYWSWKEWAFAHGSLINEMTHFADLACYFIDEPPVRVTTIGDKIANHTVVIEFADGSIANIVEAVNGTFGYPKELVEIFNNGAAIVVDHLIEMRTAGIPGQPFRKVFPISDGRVFKDGISGYYGEIKLAQERAAGSKDNSKITIPPDKGHYRLLDAFLEEVKGGKATPNTVEEAMRPTAIILKAVESCKKGTGVEISSSDYTL